MAADDHSEGVDTGVEDEVMTSGRHWCIGYKCVSFAILVGREVICLRIAGVFLQIDVACFIIDS